MSRQNKQARKSDIRKQITAVHKAAVASTGLKRVKQPFDGRACRGFTKKLTSARKGQCVVKLINNVSRRVSVSL
jgi:hypothetical protein